MKYSSHKQPEGYPADGVGFANAITTSAGHRILSLALALCLPGPVEVSAGIAKSVDGITRNSTTIGFAGVEWIVIGDATGGVQQAPVTLTLLAENKSDFGKGQFNPGYFGTAYENSLLHGAMRDIYDGFSDGREKGLINPVVLDDIVDSGGIAATLADQYVWPLAWYEWDTTPRSSNWSSQWWLRSANGIMPAIVLPALWGHRGKPLRFPPPHPPRPATGRLRRTVHLRGRGEQAPGGWAPL